MLAAMEVTTVPCLKDNYAYLVRAPGSEVVLVVDASEAAPVLAALERLRVRLGAILSTHHHHDHVGGNEELARRFPGISVLGSEHDRGRIPGQTRGVAHGETFELFGLGFRSLFVPGHTLGAVSFFGHGAVFTGDTLFAAGCGRLFEGTPELMHESLNRTLAGLPDETLVYCGHEYTVNNLRVAAHVEPGNPSVTEKAARARALRERGEPTVPSTLAEERLTNPFLRVESPEIRARYRAKLGADAPAAAVLGALRAEKDAF
jgi:hydroxyacylglutathione hydrolase